MATIKLDPNRGGLIVVGDVDHIYGSANSTATIIAFQHQSDPKDDDLDIGPSRGNDTVILSAGVIAAPDKDTQVDKEEYQNDYPRIVSSAFVVSEGNAKSSPNAINISKSESGDPEYLITPGYYKDDLEKGLQGRSIDPYKGFSHVTAIGDVVQLAARTDLNLYAATGTKLSKGGPNLGIGRINLIAGNRQADYTEEPDSSYTLEPLLKGIKTLQLLQTMLDRQADVNAESFSKGFRKILRDIFVVTIPPFPPLAPPGDYVNIAINTPLDIYGLIKNVSGAYNIIATKYNMSVTSQGPLSRNRTN